MPPRPPSEEFRSLPVYAAPTQDRVYTIEGILRSLEGGYFHDAAQLCDSMLRDDRINGCLTTRVNGLLAMPQEFEPGKDTARGRMIVEEAEDLFPQMFEDAALSDLIRWGNLLGVGVAELVWERTPDYWMPKLKVWHPQFLHWDVVKRQYQLQVERDLAADFVPLVPGDGKWVVYTPYGYEYGWLRGLVRPLARPWLIRQWTYRDWARYSEVHGLPIRKAIVPAGADIKKRTKYAGDVAKLGSETSIQLEQGQEGNKFDLQLLEATANTFAGFKELLDKCETSIAISILGQNLTTEVQGGSYAATVAHNSIRADLRRFDAFTLAACLREQALKPWVRFNYGDDELTPWVEWQTDPPDDEAQEAAALKGLGEALVAFKTATAPVDVREILECHGVPVLDEADVQAQTDAAGVPPVAPGGDGAVADPNAPVPATNGVLPRQLNRAVLSAVPRRYRKHKDAHRRGQFYADALAAKAKERAAETLRGDLADIRRIVASAASYDEIRHRLIQRFRFMSPKGLADVTEKATIMARLAGKTTVLEDI